MDRPYSHRVAPRLVCSRPASSRGTLHPGDWRAATIALRTSWVNAASLAVRFTRQSTVWHSWLTPPAGRRGLEPACSVGGSTLVTRTYPPAERTKAQAANDFAILDDRRGDPRRRSGQLLHRHGWRSILVAAGPLLALAASRDHQRRRSAPGRDAQRPARGLRLAPASPAATPVLPGRLGRLGPPTGRSDPARASLLTCAPTERSQECSEPPRVAGTNQLLVPGYGRPARTTSPSRLSAPGSRPLVDGDTCDRTRRSAVEPPGAIPALRLALLGAAVPLLP